MIQQYRCRLIDSDHMNVDEEPGGRVQMNIFRDSNHYLGGIVMEIEDVKILITQLQNHVDLEEG